MAVSSIGRDTVGQTNGVAVMAGDSAWHATAKQAKHTKNINRQDAKYAKILLVVFAS
jgi:hypothetical protein